MVNAIGWVLVLIVVGGALYLILGSLYDGIKYNNPDARDWGLMMVVSIAAIVGIFFAAVS